MICHCLKVTEQMVIEALQLHGLRTVKEIRMVTGAGDGCTACHKRLMKYIERYSYPTRVRTESEAVAISQPLPVLS